MKFSILEHTKLEQIPSGSGIVKFGADYYVISDDSPYLFTLNKEFKVISKTAILEARKANPDDTSLILSEADLYLKTNDMDTYAKLIKQVLDKDPNNADLVYNLGVVSGQNKDNKNAEIYYLKAIQLKPDFANAYYNLSAIRLDDGQDMLDQMNKLGMTAAENKKYDVLKDKRVVVLKDAATLLEKTVSLDKNNKDAKEVLLSVYKALEMKEKAKALQAELDK